MGSLLEVDDKGAWWAAEACCKLLSMLVSMFGREVLSCLTIGAALSRMLGGEVLTGSEAGKGGLDAGTTGEPPEKLLPPALAFAARRTASLSLAGGATPSGRGTVGLGSTASGAGSALTTMETDRAFAAARGVRRGRANGTGFFAEDVACG